MNRPPGSLVRICPYDWNSPLRFPAIGDYIRTVGITRGSGTVYEIESIRRVIPKKRLPRGTRARFDIRARKLGPSTMVEIPGTVRVVTMEWNPRKRRT